MSSNYDSPLANLTNNPNAIRLALGNFQPDGVAYAPTDLRKEVSNDALRSVRFVEFNSTINNAVIGNIIMGALEDRGNIYHDELLGVQDDAIEIQRRYVAESNPSELSSLDFELELAAVDMHLESELSEKGYEIDEESIPLGFYIDKYELQTTDDGGWDRRAMTPHNNRKLWKL